MDIRLAKKEDLRLFVPIKEEFYEDYGICKKTEEFINKEFDEYLKKGTIVLAVESDIIIGYLAGEIDKSLYENVGYISEVFVKKEYRGKKISTKLKDKFLEFLKKRGINICRIDVNPDNPAQESYKKWGFKIDKYRMSLAV